MHTQLDRFASILYQILSKTNNHEVLLIIFCRFVFQAMAPGVDQNHTLLDCVIRKSSVVPDSYGKFIDALHKTDQSPLARLLTSVDRELEVVTQCKSVFLLFI